LGRRRSVAAGVFTGPRGKASQRDIPKRFFQSRNLAREKLSRVRSSRRTTPNWVKEISPEGLYLELTRGAQIKIAEATLAPDAIIAPYWVQATLRNKGKAILDKKGQLWTDDGQPWIGGDPFPQPRTGLEAMWNHKSNLTRYDDVKEIASEKNVDSRGELVREGTAFVVAVQTVGRIAKEPKRCIPAYKDEHYRAVLTFLKPLMSMGSPRSVPFIMTIPDFLIPISISPRCGARDAFPQLKDSNPQAPIQLCSSAIWASTTILCLRGHGQLSEESQCSRRHQRPLCSARQSRSIYLC
jgi:hypothetical protein